MNDTNETSFKYKMIPVEVCKEYKLIDKYYESFQEFFDEYADGKKQGEGIVSLYKGSAQDTTIFWLEGEEEAFAFCQPTKINDKLFILFYLKPIIKHMEGVFKELKQDQRVEYDFSIGTDHFAGKGRIIGMSSNPLPIIGGSYIIEPDESIKSDFYPFTHFTAFQIHLKLID